MKEQNNGDCGENNREFHSSYPDWTNMTDPQKDKFKNFSRNTVGKQNEKRFISTY